MSHSLPRRALVALMFLAGMVPFARAEEEAPEREPSELTLRTTRAVVFKDGHALFIREGRAKADAEGRVYTDDVPDAAVLGSFWAFADGQRLLGMHAMLIEDRSEETEESSCITIVDLLRANRERRVTLRLTDGEELSGVLGGVLDRSRRRPPAAPPSVRRPRAPQPIPTEREVAPEGGVLVLMRETPRGEVVLPVSDVQSLSGAGLNTSMTRTFERTAVRKRLRFDVGKASAGQDVTLQLLYFAPGLRWIPTYRVAGELKTEADLALQAEVLNESADLENVGLDLVVGVPNFRFKGVVSPLVLERALVNALQQAAPQLMGQQRLSNAFFSNRAGEVVDRGGGGGSIADLAPELAAGGSQDLFVYSVPAFSLERGARATIPLWQNTIPLRHLYTIDVVLGRNLQGGGSYVRAKSSQKKLAPLELAKHLVWHNLELENRSKVPWTTGAALTMQKMVPIAQELLTYTPVGGTSLLPLTVAVDVRAGFDELEVERTPKAVRYNGRDYVGIKKKASLTLTNYRAEPTTLRARLSLGGRAFSTSDGGETRINDYRPEDWSSGGYDARLNNHSDIEWNLTLAAGETKILTCEYQFFIR